MTWVQVTPGGPDDLRHGYTLADVHRLATTTVNTHRWHQASDYRDRVDTAWHAVAEHLYASEHPPPEHDLISAARTALDRAVRDEMRHHGAERPERGKVGGWGSMPRFRLYWWDVASTVPSCERQVIEREALRQIWPRLSNTHRDVLLALAAHGTYQAAAAALGKTYGTYTVHIANARKAFLRLWHEHEQPSRVWGTDRRVAVAGAGRARPRRGTPLSKRTGKPRRPPADLPHGAERYARGPCRCRTCTEANTAAVRARRRAAGVPARHVLTPEQRQQARARRVAGEPVHAIAAELGVGAAHIYRISGPLPQREEVAH